MAIDIPSVTLDARDPHVPAALKALAAKHRPTNPELAGRLDAQAARFDAWKRQNGGVR